MVGKGLADNELTGRLHLVIDGADRRVHYTEMTDAAGNGITVDSIVEVGRAEAPPRPANRNIAELARETDAGFVTRRDMLASLARREVEETGKKLTPQHSLHFRMAKSRERISGTYRQSVQLVSGRCMLVERSREFELVPWRPVIEKSLGQHVTGLVRGSGISWDFGRKRRPDIGM